MPRWKELPTTLEPRSRRLAVQLRRLKDHSELSLAALEARTGYSRSSWERYLNGRTLPPCRAVKALADVARVDPTRLLVLREVAEAEAAGAGAGAPDVMGTAGIAGPSVEAGPARSVLLLPAVVIAVALGGLAVGLPVTGLPLTGLPVRDLSAGGPPVAGLSAAGPSVTGPWETLSRFVSRPGTTYPCRVERWHGRLTAGYSATREVVLRPTTGSWDVVEAQCLLRHHGFDPGGVDGTYGEPTVRAVERAQKQAHLAVDGRVGPRTWLVLRR